MNSHKGISVGDKVVVTGRDHTFDMFDCWQHINQVPDFSAGSCPEYGDVHTVTFIGEHSPDFAEVNDSWVIFVLDGTYMMNIHGINLV